MLVAVQADAVAEAMGEEFITGAVTCGCHDGASGIIHCAGESSGASSIEGRVLGFAQRIKHLDELLGRLFAENDGARYVGFVSFYFRAAVDQDNIARL